jgi:hypothetical protein
MTAQVTTASAETNSRPTTGERRASPRYCCMSECLVRMEGAAEPLDWPGMVYNISAGGIGLALPFPAVAGSILVIEPRGRRRAPMPLRARVLRCGLQKFVWFHGAEFVAPLGEEELEWWLTELRADRSSGE